jgi:dienelactone hydrolase
MRMFRAFLALAALAALSGQTLRPFPPDIDFRPLPGGVRGDARPVDAEGEFDRQQSWLLPSPDPAKPAHAFLYRPPGDGPFRLAVIAHASVENELRRAQMPQPDYRALAAFLVVRGFAVLVPERLGHGATGGTYAEAQGDCEHPDYDASARAVSRQIALAVGAMRLQPFIRGDGAVVIGHSAGGWGALELAGHRPGGVAAIVVFAPGRGGHADDVPGKVCAPETLIKTAEEFGKRARIPVTWLVADNDSYFPPELSRQMADAFRRGGGRVAFTVLPATGHEGHAMAETEAGVALASSEVDRALWSSAGAAAKKP